MSLVNVIPQPLTPNQLEEVDKTLLTQGYPLLREIIAANAIKAAMEFTDAALYDNENGRAKADQSRKEAERYNTALDVLDHLEKNREEWALVRLEPKR